MSSQTKDPTSDTNMDVSYVLVYHFADTERSSAIAQFQKLNEALASVGLTTEVRTKDQSSLFVFMKFASNQDLYEQIYRSRTKDWLHGVRQEAPNADSSDSEDKRQINPAEPLRIVYQLIINPRSEGGAGITPKHGEWKNVESILALHDHQYNKSWIKKWATSYTLKVEDLDDIRDHFGEKVAYYFAFTQSYFTALIGIAAFGGSSWFLLGYFSPVYAIINSLLCVAFIEYWKSQEYDLSVRWETRGVSAIESKRHDFEAEKDVTDPVTGETVKFFPSGKRLQRQLLQLPFAVLATLILGSLIATCFSIEIFISEIYNGPGQSVLVFLPTGILTAFQPLLLGFLTNVAEKLSAFENYETDSAFDTAFTQKIFVLNFITSYLPILLTAFVYVPFAKELVPYLDVIGITSKPPTEGEKSHKIHNFEINPNRLKKQVIYFTVTAQIVNQAMEVVVPYLKQWATGKYQDYQKKRSASKEAESDPSANDLPEETEFLKRVRKEADLPAYDVTTDLREMVIQYGYLVLFSVVFPPTGISFLINNWIELRTDAIKICTETQRPTPWRADSIGPWLDSLGFLTWLGSVSTAAIVYMFNGGDGGDEGPGGSPARLQLGGLMLSIFASEHAYLLVRHVVRIAISKLDSPGAQKERAEKFMVRRKYLGEAGALNAKHHGERMAEKMGAAEKESAMSGGGAGLSREELEEALRKGPLQGPSLQQRFWCRQKNWKDSANVGAQLIEQGLKEGEGKKTQ